MRRWILVAALSLISGTSEAQDGLRSPVLPDRAPNQPLPPTATDQFRVPPDFYNRPPVQPTVPGGGVVIGGYGPWSERSSRRRFDDSRDSRRSDELRELRRERRLIEEASRRAEAAQQRAEQAAALPPLAPGKPKTIYVIPGCYAGDRRPDLTRLPRECRASQLRVIPPT